MDGKRDSAYDRKTRRLTGITQDHLSLWPMMDEAELMELFTKKIWWLLTAAWAGMIFNLSRAPYASASSEKLLCKVLDWFSILPQNLNLLNNVLRKSAHLTEYAVLAVFLYNAMKPVGAPSWSGKAAFWALLASGSYSLTDEFHQMFVPGRRASLFDCLIDTTGAFLGLFVLFNIILMFRLKQAGLVTQTSKPFHEME
jgi:VanZ family protein